MIVEVAVAVVLLSGAGLMIRSFQRLVNVDPGFKPAHVLAARIQLPRFEHVRRHTIPAKPWPSFDSLLDRLKSLPGVESAALVSEPPLSGQNNDTWFTIEGRPPLAPSDRPDADQRTISTEYFQTMGIPLIKGRYFTRNDTLQSARVVIISQSLAERYFPVQNPLATFEHRFRVALSMRDCGGSGRCPPPVLGRTRATYQLHFAGPTACGTRQRGGAGGKLDVMTLAHAITQQVQALNDDVPVFEFHSLNDYVADSVDNRVFRTLLLGNVCGGGPGYPGWGRNLRSDVILGFASHQRTRDSCSVGRRTKGSDAPGSGAGDAASLGGSRHCVVATAAALARLIAGMLYE